MAQAIVLPKETISGNKNNEITIPPPVTQIHFPKHPGSLRTFDFSSYYGEQCDHIVYECQQIIEELLKESILTAGQTLSVYSIVCYCRGLKIFLPFCHFMAKTYAKELNISDINSDLIKQFINFLAETNPEKVTQKNIFTFTKSVLNCLIKKGLLNQNIFPKNPFPNINQKKNGQRPLSKQELRKFTTALKNELHRISRETQLLSSYDLSICVLLIALRTGLNPTPIIELSTESIQPHPLKNNRQLLVSYKRRGRNTHIQSIRHSTKINIMKTIMMDVVEAITLITKRNQSIRMHSKYPNHLFVFQRTSAHKDNVGLLSQNTLLKCIKLFVAKNYLTDSDNMPLSLNVMRLRKTFVNRIWELSGQDPFVTASLAGHNVKISNDHYLEAPQEAQNNWRLMGELRNQELLNLKQTPDIETQNTPIAKCKNTMHGDFAPKNGEHCINFMACFRCSSFVVTEDDLYRLLSFYWLLVKERNVIGAKSWNRYYAHIIRIIDTQIIPYFNPQKVEQEKAHANKEPHPFWCTSEQLTLETK